MPLPQVRPPVSWVLGVESYKLAAESTLPKLREMLGDWPTHETRSGGPDSVVKFAIRHRLSRDESEARSDWSRLAVFSYEGPEPEAMRLDGWQCDEPAPHGFIDALRNRGKAGRALYGFHTLTPIKANDWEPVFADFTGDHGRIVDGRLRLQSSVYENRALHQRGCSFTGPGCQCPDILRAEQQVRTSPWRAARLFGEPVNIAGTCPFDLETLIAMREEAKPGERYAYGWNYRDGRDVLWPQRHDRGTLESWGWGKAGDRVLIVADPSSGVRDPDKSDAQQPRNPSGLLAWSVALQRDLVRFNGYVPAHELGQMAKAVANKCRNWVLIHETNGGWGEAFLRGFRESPPLTEGELWLESDPETGKTSAQPGWRQSTQALGKLMAALQRGIQSGGMKIHSRAAIDHLLKTRLDANERWDRGDGRGPHGEDVILYGIAAYVAERSTLPTRAEKLRDMDMNLGKLIRPASPEAEGVVERW